LARQEKEPGLDDVASSDFIRNSLCALVTSDQFHIAIAQTTVIVHNTLSLIAMVRTGQWITVLPESVLSLFPEGLCFRPLRGLRDTRQVNLLLRERSPFLPLAKEMGQLLSQSTKEPVNQN
jgi:DNA-binding transcriptional LysR family regulator